MAKRNSGEPLKEEDKKKLNTENLKKLLGIFQFLLPHKIIFLIGLIALFISSVTLLAFPRIAGEMLDIATGRPKYFPTLEAAGIALLAILLTQAIFAFVRVYTFSIVTERGLADIRKSVYAKMIWMPMTFFDSRRVGELMSRLTADIEILHSTFSLTLAEFVRQIITLVFGTAFIFYIAPRLSVFMILIFPVLIVAALIFGKYIRKLSKETQESLGATNTIVEETLQNVSAVKAFTNEIFEINRYGQSVDRVIGTAIRASKYRGLFISFIIFALFGGIVSVGWYGASLVQDGTITTGVLFSFIIYTSVLGFSMAGLGDIFSQLQRSIGASERILEILNEKDEVQVFPSASTGIVKLKGHIEFNAVSFTYPTRKDFTVLKGLNFAINPGEKIALIGKSGSGKSTIINLLMRFYPVEVGSIRIDGKPVSDYNLSAYRQNIGIVPQEVILFGGTILENIAYGNPEANETEIREAARKANALDFIESFPEKFKTVVGDRGIKLSGGQRQRIAIARAILKDPSILILDEATSSLDAQSEILVQEALEKLMEGRTTIIIAHRLSTIKKVDRILVIQDGALMETGSHTELTQLNNGIYSNLLKLQLR